MSNDKNKRDYIISTTGTMPGFGPEPAKYTKHQIPNSPLLENIMSPEEEKEYYAPELIEEGNFIKPSFLEKKPIPMGTPKELPTILPDRNKAAILYNGLSQRHSDMLYDFTEFYKRLATPGKAQILYEGLIRDYGEGSKSVFGETYDDFAVKLGVSDTAKDLYTDPKRQMMHNIDMQRSGVNAAHAVDAFDQLRNYMRSRGLSLTEAPENVRWAEDTPDNIKELYGHYASFRQNTPYWDELWKEYDKSPASLRSQNLKDLYNYLNTEIGRIEESMQERNKEALKLAKEYSRDPDFGFSAPLPVQSELRQLRKRLNLPKRGEEGDAGSWIKQLTKGFGAGFSLSDLVTLGWGDLVPAMEENRVLEKLEKGEPLNEYEQDIFDLIELKQNVEGYIQSMGGVTTAASVGEGIGQMVPYMAGFATGAAGARAITAPLMKKIIKEGTKTWVKGLTTAAINAMPATVLTPTAHLDFQQRTKEQYFDDSGSLHFDEEGNLHKWQPTSAGKRLYQAAVTGFLENFSEMGIGDLISAPLSKIAKTVGNHIGLGKLYKMVDDNNLMRSLRNSVNWSGSTGEFMEELFVNITQPLLTLEPEKLSETLSAQNLWETYLICAITGGAMNVTAASGTVLNNATTNQYLRNKEKDNLKAISSEYIRNAVHDAMHQSSVSDMTTALSEINWSEATQEDIDGVWGYIQSRINRKMYSSAGEAQKNVREFADRFANIETFTYKYIPGQTDKDGKTNPAHKSDTVDDKVVLCQYNGGTVAIKVGDYKSDNSTTPITVVDKTGTGKEVSLGQVSNIQEFSVADYMQKAFAEITQGSASIASTNEIKEDAEISQAAGIEPIETVDEAIAENASTVSVAEQDNRAKDSYGVGEEIMTTDGRKARIYEVDSWAKKYRVQYWDDEAQEYSNSGLGEVSYADVAGVPQVQSFDELQREAEDLLNKSNQVAEASEAMAPTEDTAPQSPEDQAGKAIIDKVRENNHNIGDTDVLSLVSKWRDKQSEQLATVTQKLEDTADADEYSTISAERNAIQEKIAAYDAAIAMLGGTQSTVEATTTPNVESEAQPTPEVEAATPPTEQATPTYRLSEEIDDNGRPFVKSSNGSIEFGLVERESGLTPAPILLSEGMITNPQTNDGYGLVHIEARHGDQIRKAGYRSVVDFIEAVAKSYTTIREGKKRDGQQTYLLQLTDKHNNTLMVELSSDGNYWNINTAGIFKMSYGKNGKVVYNRYTTAKQTAESVEVSQESEQSGSTETPSISTPASPSDNKDTTFVPEKQISDKESIDTQVTQAEQDTDIYPFEGSTKYYYEPELETRPQTSNAEQLTPVEIGESSWGKVYQWVKGKVLEAANFLKRAQSGYLKGVFYREGVGDIDMVWGNKNGGLYHIIDKHIINYSDFSSIEEAISVIEDTIDSGKITHDENRILFTKGAYRVVTEETSEGGWIVSAYDHRRSMKNKKRSEEDATLFRQAIFNGENGTPVSPNSTSSEDKYTTTKPKKQVKKEVVLKSSASSGEKIDDFGEKIGGARKDVARERVKDSAKLSRTDLVTLKDPDKILSRTNIIKYMREGQMTPDDATALLALNMAVRGNSGGNSKAVLMDKYRQCALDWVEGKNLSVEITDADVEAYVSAFSETIRSRSNFVEVARKDLEYALKTYQDYKTTYEAINYPEVNRAIKSAYIRYEEFDQRYWVVGSPAARRGFPFSTLEQAVSKLQKEYPEVQEVPAKSSDSTASEDKVGHLYITKDNRGYYRIKSRQIPGNIYLSGRLYSKKEAEQYLKDNAEKLVAREERMSETLMGSNIGMVERQGKDYRKGKDVTPQDFLDTFGFRGVEFGNWVPQAERQLYLNKSYDAIMDLCEAVGISPKAFSLGGRLGLAFGARGKSRALAHYEPVKEVINLTRLKGAGSLAHEWFHALDNYMSKQVTGNVTEMATSTYRAERTEVAEAFRELVREMDKLLYTKRSQNAGDYWGEVWERAARLFQSYIYNNLQEKNTTSPLLVRGDALFAESDNADTDFEASSYPYPSAEENEKMKPYFDKLFDTIQEREVGGKTILYQVEEGEIAPSDAALTTQEIVDLVRATGVEVEVVTPEDMVKPEGVVYGWMSDGKIYLTEQGLNPETPIHEYTHIWDMICQKENPDLWAEGVKLMKQLPLWEQVKSNPNYANLADNENLLASEVHARLVAPGSADVLAEMLEEKKVRPTLVGRLRTWLSKVWRWLRSNLLPGTKLTVEQFKNMPLRTLAEGEVAGGQDSIRFRSNKAANYTPEEQEIVAKAKADGTYLLAPNGQPTNLTPKQWAQVRTKAFKEWFGDWLKAARIEKLRNSKSVEITGREFEITFDFKENKKNALRYSQTFSGKKYKNNDTGESIGIYKGRQNGGVKEVLQHNYKDIPHIQSIAAIPEIIKNSIYIESQPNKDLERNPNVTKYQCYVCGLNIAGEDYTVLAKVAVDKAGNRYYDHNLTAVEKGKLIDIANNEQSAITSGFSTTPDTKSTTNSQRKYKELVSILQTNASKVVDANGEPKVVFHGTIRKQYRKFNVFNTENTPAWFTDNKIYSEAYTKDKKPYQRSDIYSTFLNVRNPIDLGFIDYGGSSLLKDLARQVNVGEEILNPIFEKYNPSWMWQITNTPEFKELMEGLGCDGYMAREAGTNSFAAFYPNQIKSATENIGIFDASNDDIRYRSGEVETVAPEERAIIDKAVANGTYLFAPNGKRSDLTPEMWTTARTEAFKGRFGDWESSPKNYLGQLNVKGEPSVTDVASFIREQKKQQMAEAANTLSATLNTPVEVYMNVEDITDPNAYRQRRMRRDKGWWTSDGKIGINLSMHESVADVEATILHEVVGHKGLREVVGSEEAYNELLDRVWSRLTFEEQQLWESRYDDRYEAMDEYLATLAEGNVTLGVWDRIIGWFRELLDRITGRKLQISDRDIAYLLWKSRARLQKPKTPEEVVAMARTDKKYRAEAYRSRKSTSKTRELKYLERFSEPVTTNHVRYYTARNGITDKLVSEDNRKAFLHELFEWLPQEYKNIVRKRRPKAPLEELDRLLYMKQKERSTDCLRGIIGDKLFDAVLSQVLPTYWNKEYVNGILRRGFQREQIRAGREDKGQTYLDKGNPNATFEDTGKVGSRRFVRRFVDTGEPVKELQQRLVEAFGVVIDASNDLYSALNRWASRAQVMVDRFIQGYVNPLLSTIQDIESKTSMKFMEVVDYMTYKHAVERHMSGITTFPSDMNGDLKSEDVVLKYPDWNLAYAENFIKQFEKSVPKKLIDELWSRVNLLNKTTLDNLVASGNISLETKERILSHKWKYYVPLTDWDLSATTAVDAEKFYDFGETPHPKGVSASVLIRQIDKGRQTKPANPLVNMISFGGRAIISGENNKMKQVAWKLVSDARAAAEKIGKHPDRVFDIVKRYFVKDGTGQWREKPMDEEITAKFLEQLELSKKLRKVIGGYKKQLMNKDLSPAQKEDIYNSIIRLQEEERVREVRRNENGMPGELPLAYELDGQRMVNLYINGEKQTIKFADPLVAMAINGELTTAQGKLSKFIGRLTRTLSSLFTSYNPAFVVSNMVRDFRHSFRVHLLDSTYGSATSFTRNLPATYKTIWRAERGKANPLTVDEVGDYDIFHSVEDRAMLMEKFGRNRVLDTLYNDFIEQGGLTGYVFTQSYDEIESNLRRLARRNAIKSKSKVARGVLDGVEATKEWYEALASVSEGSTRFATYMASLETGVSTTKATQNAKDVTVNFNRKGEWSKVLGSLYLFFNASVQAANQEFNVAKNNPKRVALFAAYRVANSILNSLLLAYTLDLINGDDEDERNDVEVPMHVRLTNTVIPLLSSGKYIKIPLAQGFETLFNSLGVYLYELMSGEITGKEFVKELARLPFDTFSPLAIPENGSLMRTVLPTVFTPFYDIAVNEDYLGRPIHRERYSDATPSYRLGLKNTPEFFVKWAKAMNTMLGGNEIERGSKNDKGEITGLKVLEWNPSDIQHVIQYYAGGSIFGGKFLWNTVNTFDYFHDMITEGKSDIDIYNELPIVRRFLGEAYVPSKSGDYYHLLNRLKVQHDDYLKYRKRKQETGEPIPENILRDEKFYKYINRIHKVVKRKQELITENDPDPEKQKAIQQEVQDIMFEGIFIDERVDTSDPDWDKQFSKAIEEYNQKYRQR